MTCKKQIFQPTSCRNLVIKFTKNAACQRFAIQRRGKFFLQPSLLSHPLGVFSRLKCCKGLVWHTHQRKFLHREKFAQGHETSSFVARYWFTTILNIQFTRLVDQSKSASSKVNLPISMKLPSISRRFDTPRKRSGVKARVVIRAFCRILSQRFWRSETFRNSLIFFSCFFAARTVKRSSANSGVTPAWKFS